MVVDEVEFARERLNEMVQSDLQVFCCYKKLPVSGSNAVLVDRIIAGGGAGALHNNSSQQNKEALTYLIVLITTWFIAPFKSKACGEGTINKPFIFKNFPTLILQKSVAYLASANCRIKIESLHEFGLLLCHTDEDLAELSPDAIAGVIEKSGGQF